MKVLKGKLTLNRYLVQYYSYAIFPIIFHTGLATAEEFPWLRLIACAIFNLKKLLFHDVEGTIVG